VIEGLPDDYGPWERWGTDLHGELAVVEQAQRAERTFLYNGCEADVSIGLDD